MAKPVVLVTGCSEGGIGNALCIEFHKVRYSLAMTSGEIYIVNLWPPMKSASFLR